ncbi:hypothetical protein J2Z31_003969 [Sinorhizobium kostiense]|uniref:Uncharacterized protein n=1 Tax=Sinorhizobium kostiense TaxID=76747 RepID=A0ABS4R3J4_9HYPH|nr:hypothetical protein [Sinorhizobium kostiense]
MLEVEIGLGVSVTMVAEATFEGNAPTSREAADPLFLRHFLAPDEENPAWFPRVSRANFL